MALDRRDAGAELVQLSQYAGDQPGLVGQGVF